MSWIPSAVSGIEAGALEITLQSRALPGQQERQEKEEPKTEGEDPGSGALEDCNSGIPSAVSGIEAGAPEMTLRSRALPGQEEHQEKEEPKTEGEDPGTGGALGDWNSGIPSVVSGIEAGAPEMTVRSRALQGQQDHQEKEEPKTEGEDPGSSALGDWNSGIPSAVSGIEAGAPEMTLRSRALPGQQEHQEKEEPKAEGEDPGSGALGDWNSGIPSAVSGIEAGAPEMTLRTRALPGQQKHHEKEEPKTEGEDPGSGARGDWNSAQLKACDLHLMANRAEHHTDHYHSPGLIVRRGQTFKITLPFDGDLQPNESIIFTASTGPASAKPEDSNHSFTLSSSKSRDAWNAVLQSRSSNSLDVVISSPANVVIGHYELSVLISSERESVHQIEKFTLLFNPWCSDDEVYMPDENERNEYVLNDHGILYLGNIKYIDQQGWNYGQFEENILDICLDIMDHNLNYYKDPAKDCSQRGDPIYIGRVVSTMVNCNDDQGVLMGTWSGDYSDGVDPITWSGSVDILRKWHQGGYEPVRYGQCWVFAGVMCTVLRCLGIPNRPVTNFVSAHDAEGNLRVQEYYDISGTVLKKSRDSVWTYHVWNEAWFTRKDLGPFYNGWQVLDATAQERSEGVYCCGPASVNAVREGEVELAYDGLFVFAEVNADILTYICYDDDVTEEVYTDSRMIGQSVSTKAVGNDSRVDITHNYKYPEGSHQEREVFKKARKLAFKNTPTDGENKKGANLEEVSGISGQFMLVKSPVVGQDIHLMLIIKNLTTYECTVQVNLSSSSILHNRQPKGMILKASASLTLDHEEEMKIPFEIPYSEYVKSLSSDNLIEVAALFEVESGRKLLVRRDISLENPPLIIQVLGNAVVNQPVTVEVAFTNPLSEDGIGCALVAEGSGLIEGQLRKRLPPLNPRESSKVQFNITPSRSGTRQLLVSLTSKTFPTIKGFQGIEVEAA